MNIIVTHNVQLGLSKTLKASRHQATLCQDDSIHDPEMRQSALQLTPREAAALAERCECPLPCGQLGTPVMLTRRAPKAYLSERTSLFLATKCHDDRVKASHTFHKIVSTLLECHLPTHSGYKRSRPFWMYGKLPPTRCMSRRLLATHAPENPQRAEFAHYDEEILHVTLCCPSCPDLPHWLCCVWSGGGCQTRIHGWSEQ